MSNNEDEDEDEDEEDNDNDNDKEDEDEDNDEDRRKLKRQISELEDSLLQPRSWELMGEATADRRGENELLEVDLDVDRVGATAPVSGAAREGEEASGGGIDGEECEGSRRDLRGRVHAAGAQLRQEEGGAGRQEGVPSLSPSVVEGAAAALHQAVRGARPTLQRPLHARGGGEDAGGGLDGAGSGDGGGAADQRVEGDAADAGGGGCEGEK